MVFNLKLYSNKATLFFLLSVFILSLGLIFGLFYFTQAETGSSDLIAIRIFSNPEHLTPSKWYQENVPRPGSPSLLEVDGYEAVQDGRTIYINGTNVVDNPGTCPTGKCIYTNIYMLSYSEGAVSATTQVFQQIRKNFEININLSNLKVCNNIETYYCTQEKNNCTDSGGGPKQDLCTGGDKDLCQLISCTSDLDCKSYAGSPPCEAEKDKLRRDTKRLSDLEEMSAIIQKYKGKTGQLPRLEAGTYLKEHSFSTWPSWQATLGNELGGSMPQDPINKFFGCRPTCCDTGTCAGGELCPDASTCWDEKDLTLGCPRDAYLYGYNYDEVSNSARIFYNVEYRRADWREQAIGDIAPGDLLDILMVSKCAGGPNDGDDCDNDNDCRVGGLPVEAKCMYYCFGHQGVTTDDFDSDGVPDTKDNCPFDANLDQADADHDGLGDVCDPCPSDSNNDSDQDGICNGGQYKPPAIGINDNCPTVFNPDQTDSNNNGIGDVCEACIDLDHDQVCENGLHPDNCPGIYNPDQTDEDLGSGEIKIKALIDGKSQLILKHNTAQWHHLQYELPGKHGGADEPTVINDIEWQPTWPSPTCTDCYSSNIFKELFPRIPDRTDIILKSSELQIDDPDHASGSATVIEYPSVANDYALIIEFNDTSPNGAAHYEITLDLVNVAVGDGIGDACDICPLDKYNDVDDDGVCGDVDNCPVNYNPGQEDFDLDAANCNFDKNSDGSRNDQGPYCGGLALPGAGGTCPINNPQCGGNACDEAYCGNGILDPGEICDSGLSNGTSPDDQYQCLQCKEWSGGYCGDGIIQYQFGEICDCGAKEKIFEDGKLIEIKGICPAGEAGGSKAGMSEENQYQCVKTCKEWAGGWCGDRKVQTTFGETCEEPGKGTAISDQYSCVDCAWQGGYCGDAEVQTWYGEQCDQNTGGGSGLSDQYFCTCSATRCPTKVCQKKATTFCQSDTDCVSGSTDNGPCVVYEDKCKWAGGYCGDGIVQADYEQCDVLDPNYNVEVVFIFDTSSSMCDDALSFCSNIGIVQAELEEIGFNLNLSVYSISNETHQCDIDSVRSILEGCPDFKGDIAHSYPPNPINQLEDWGPAISAVALNKKWLDGYLRVIVTFSDEGAQDGGGYPTDPWDNADAAAVNQAISNSVNNGIVLLHVFGTNEWVDGDPTATPPIPPVEQWCDHHSRYEELYDWLVEEFSHTNGQMIQERVAPSGTKISCHLKGFFRFLNCLDLLGNMNCKVDHTTCSL